MLPDEYNYYSDRLTKEERMEYLNLVNTHTMKRIDENEFNSAHDSFWKRVKERVDKQEGKIK